jgi:tRNA/rRNA methyltransferase
MTTSFILVNPTVPENIGAAARAIKTMGFSNLRLISPCDYLCEKALMLAHGSHDILKNAMVFGSLADALVDIDFSIATSAKQRWVKQNVINIREINSFIENKGNTINNLAFVFGGEESGLSNENISLCDIVSTINLAEPFPSLNLAQAVMVFAFSLSGLYQKRNKEFQGESYCMSYKPLKEKVISILHEIGIPSESLVHGRVLERLANTDAQDIKLLHSVTTKIIERLRKKDKK